MNVTIPRHINQILCIADIKSTLVFKKFDFSHIQTYDFFTCHRRKEGFTINLARPDSVAMRFYLMDLYMHEITKARGQYWGNLDTNWQVKLGEYANFLAEESFRSIHYLVAICIREARHAKGLEDPKMLIRHGLFPDGGLHKNQYAVVDKLNNLHMDLKEDSFFVMEGHQVTDYVLEGFPQGYTLEDTLRYVKLLFDGADWDSSYGGSAWSDLTAAALEVVTGKRSLYEGLDNAFSLVHNNGSIFNKSFFYNNEFSEKFGMKFLLDCQRSGQLVNAALEGYLANAMLWEHGPAQFPFTKQERIKGMLIYESKEGLYPLIRELAELNPEYAKPFSFIKMVADGALGEYKFEVNAEVNRMENSKEGLKAYKDYFEGVQNPSFVATKSSLEYDPFAPELEWLPVNVGTELQQYATTNLKLNMGKGGLSHEGSHEVFMEYPVFKPHKILKRVT